MSRNVFAGILLLLGYFSACFAANSSIGIVGFSGTQGSRIAGRFLADKAGWDVVVIGRNAAKAKNFEKMGATFRYGDLGNQSSLMTAFKGLKLVWFTPVSMEKSTQKDLGAKDGVETQQAITVYDAAVEARIEHLLFGSVLQIPGLEGKSGTFILDDKWKAKQYFDSQNKLSYTEIRPGEFVDNLITRGFEAVFAITSGTIWSPWPIDSPVPWVTVRDIAEVTFIAASTRPAIAQVQSFTDSPQEMAEKLGKLRNNPDYHANAVPGFVMKFFAKPVYDLIQLCLADGRSELFDEIHKETVGIMGPTFTFEDWVRDEGLHLKTLPDPLPLWMPVSAVTTFFLVVVFVGTTIALKCCCSSNNSKVKKQ